MTVSRRWAIVGILAWAAAACDGPAGSDADTIRPGRRDAATDASDAGIDASDGGIDASDTGTDASDAGTDASVPPTGRIYGTLLTDSRYLASDYAAGVRMAEYEIGWDTYEPADGAFSAARATQVRAALQQLRDAGYVIQLDFGLQYPPSWVTAIEPWRDQYGNAFDGQVNVWNAAVRARVERYIARVFADLGTSFYAVRVGSGASVETLYPDNGPGASFSYWAFSASALARDPVPAWRPGQPSPNGEARTFYDWYVQSLIDVVNWQHDVIRRAYAGRILQLFPGLGVRPAGYDTLIRYNLIANGQIGVDAAGRAAVWHRIVPGIRNRTNVVVVCSSVGDSTASASWVNEASTDPLAWSSAHWVAWNADQVGLPKWAENVGSNDYANMRLVFQQLGQYGYTGLSWAHDSDLHDGVHATVDQYGVLIQNNP